MSSYDIYQSEGFIIGSNQLVILPKANHANDR